jgi:hypothetical protein
MGRTACTRVHFTFYSYHTVYDTKIVQTNILNKPEYKVFLPEIAIQKSTVHLIS